MRATGNSNEVCDIGHVVTDDACRDPRVTRSRTKVLDAATALLVEHGARGVTVDAVAERSGVAKSTLYRHWPSRTALLVDVLRSNIPHVAEPDLSHGFEHALRTHVADVAATFADPEWARMLPALFVLKRQLNDVEELADDDQEQKLSVIERILELGVSEGRVPADLDPTLVASTLVGPMMFTILVGEGDACAASEFALERFLDSFADPTP